MPSFTVWLAVMLALVCVAAFIGFIHHIAQSIRAAVVIQRVGDETRAALERLYPEAIGEEVDVTPAELDEPASLELRHDGKGAVLAGVDGDALLRAVCGSGVAVRVIPHVGDYVPHGAVVLTAHGPADALDAKRALAALAFRRERDVHDDAAFGLRELVDIAERALSPGTNDPSTAVQVLDELHDILRRLARRKFPSEVRRTAEGRIVVVLPRPSFDELVRLSVEEIRHYASGSVQVLRRLHDMLADLTRFAPPPRRTEVDAQLALVATAIARAFPDARDRASALCAHRNSARERRR